MVFGNSLPGVKVIPKPVTASAADSYILSPEQFKFFDDNGYLVIKGLIGFDELYTYKKRFLQICSGLVPDSNIMVVKEPSLVKNKNLKPEDYINKLQEISYDEVFGTYGEHPKILSVLSQFIGDDITAIHSIFINKPPGSSRHPAHQDQFYFPLRPSEKIIGVWTAVDDVNYENGCLFVVPGSHKNKTIYNHNTKDDTIKLYHGIENEDTLAHPDKVVHLEMAPGDTVLLNSLLIHGSGANVSKNYRKAITFHYANSSCYYIDTKDTVHEYLVKQLSDKFGIEIDFVEYWKAKSKQVKGVRSNL